MVLRDGAVAPGFFINVWRIKDFGKIDALGFPVVDGGSNAQLLHAPYHLIDGSETELRHDLAQVFGNEAHEIDNVRWVTHETLSKFRVLRGDTNGAGIEMADAHHDASESDQRGG